LVSLFSGGMDSFAGAVLAVRTAQRPLLVGHWNWTPTSAIQGAARVALRRLTGADPEFRGFRVGRRSVQVNGIRFGEERTSRSRSLLFVAIGVALATGTRAHELWIPENGWVSLNVPLDGSRRGTLSTRTTHPGVIYELNGLLRDLGIGLAIRNPWEGRTKGDLVQWVAEQWDPEAASGALTATNSCARSDMRFFRQHPNAHCGVCYACLVRRAAFIAGGTADGTPYVEEFLRLDPGERDLFMRSRGRDLAAVRGAIARGGFSLVDVLALDLPLRYTPGDTLELANRGLQELAAVNLP
jgi:hypothetical protein